MAHDAKGSGLLYGKAFSFISCLLAISLFACQRESGKLVTPRGGTVSDPGGVTMVIPAGALSENTYITVTTFHDEADMPDDGGPLINFNGAADFGPDGTEFQIPVYVTFPSNTPLLPGARFPLFRYDEENEIWVQTRAIATVDDDGQSFSAEITHFSLHGGDGSLGEGGLLDNFDDNFGDGSDPEGALDAYYNWLAEQRPVGYQTVHDGRCVEVVGHFVELVYNVNGVQGDPLRAGGRSSDYTFMVDYTTDIVYKGASTYYNLLAVIYYDCSDPRFTVRADPAHISQGEQSTITARLACGEEPMGGKQLTFEAVGGLGTVNPGEAATSSGGEAQTTFTAQEEEGRESIHVRFSACEGLEGEHEMISAAIVDIGSTGSGTLELHFTNVFPAFNASTQVSVNLDEEGGVTFGTGTLTYEGEDDNGQLKIRRSGTITLAPYGSTYETANDLRIDVKENATINERLQTWVWAETFWMPVLNETISDTWNGGLVFYRSEAEAGGSTLQVATSQGSVTWTLRLDPDR